METYYVVEIIPYGAGWFSKDIVSDFYKSLESATNYLKAIAEKGNSQRINYVLEVDDESNLPYLEYMNLWPQENYVAYKIQKSEVRD